MNKTKCDHSIVNCGGAPEWRKQCNKCGALWNHTRQVWIPIQKDYAESLVKARGLLHEDNLATLIGDRSYEEAAHMVITAKNHLQDAAIVLLEMALAKLEQENAVLQAKRATKVPA